MLLASFSRLALVGATMFSLIAASDSSQSDSGGPVEKRNSFDNSLQASVACVAAEDCDLSWILLQAEKLALKA